MSRATSGVSGRRASVPERGHEPRLARGMRKSAPEELAWRAQSHNAPRSQKLAESGIPNVSFPLLSSPRPRSPLFPPHLPFNLFSTGPNICVFFFTSQSGRPGRLTPPGRKPPTPSKWPPLFRTTVAYFGSN